MSEKNTFALLFCDIQQGEYESIIRAYEKTPHQNNKRIL